MIRTNEQQEGSSESRGKQKARFFQAKECCLVSLVGGCNELCLIGLIQKVQLAFISDQPLSRIRSGAERGDASRPLIFSVQLEVNSGVEISLHMARQDVSL